MKKSPLFAAFIVLLVLLGGGLLLRHGFRNVETPPTFVVPASQTTVSATPVPTLVAPVVTTAPAVSFNTTRVITPAASTSASIESLLSDTSLDEKTVMAGLAGITLDASRSLPERTEALSHLLNLSATDPSLTLLPLITDARLPDSLCNQILDDALNASQAWQADACLAALTHRKDKEIQTKAHEHLTFLVGTDYGDNLAEWAKAVALSKKAWTENS